MDKRELLRAHYAVGDIREFLGTEEAYDMYDPRFIELLVEDLNSLQKKLAGVIFTGVDR